MDSAGTVLTDYLKAQEKSLRLRVDDVRHDRPDAVHRSRVATRRARSVLRTYAPLFRKAPRTAVRRELSWYADALGAPRDAEVIRARLLDALDRLPEDDLDGPVKQRLDRVLTADHRRAHADLVSAMSTARFARLSTRFAALVVDPPWRSPGEERAANVLPDLWCGAIDITTARIRDAEQTPEDLAPWHEVRKAAKAARYGSEALKPLTPAATKHAKAWARVTAALGEVQDTVVAEQALRRVRAEAAGAGEPLHTYTALLERERERRTDALADGRRSAARALALPRL